MERDEAMVQALKEIGFTLLVTSIIFLILIFAMKLTTPAHAMGLHACMGTEAVKQDHDRCTWHDVEGKREWNPNRAWSGIKFDRHHRDHERHRRHRHEDLPAVAAPQQANPTFSQIESQRIEPRRVPTYVFIHGRPAPGCDRQCMIDEVDMTLRTRGFYNIIGTVSFEGLKL
jgi:hypothetical protein